MAVLDLDGGCGCDDDGRRPRRGGTAWTCAAHVITAVIGSGVRSLAWSVAQLGWLAGPACMLCFALVTYVSAALLADCYCRGDPEKGLPRNRCYTDAVRAYLGTVARHHHHDTSTAAVLVRRYLQQQPWTRERDKLISRPTSFVSLWCGFMMAFFPLNDPCVSCVGMAACSGKKHTWACGSLQFVSLYGCGVAYTITTATSIR